MDAPKEFWVAVYKDGSGTALPNKEDAEGLGTVRGVHRYVLARPGREAVAWIVKRRSSAYYMGHVMWTSKTFARRFPTRDEAQKEADFAAERNTGVRVVKLVRSVKP